MYKYLLAVLLVFLKGPANAQISPTLQDKLEAAEEELVPAVLVFEAADFEAMERWFLQNNIHAEVRPAYVNRQLKKHAEESQRAVLEKLGQYSKDELASVHPFYIANIIVIQAQKELILEMAGESKVQWVDWAGYEIIPHDPVIKEGSRKSIRVSGTEPGLVAINAPPMWELGYTGRGRLAYIYDTGVWPTHPAFGNRFYSNYATLKQSWYGHYNPFPTSAKGDHGTHVLGTVAGLDKRNNDTIGVAFESYWIANDLIGGASVAAQLPPLVYMVEAFEWALNPDGDSSTSSDVPDVINNSWRWRDEPDTVHCGGYIVQLMNAIEAAGIANVFSGGNSGPNNSAVNSPQRINTSKTNTFSVGSVNGNLGFPYPISGFSTRGPTQCPGSGNLLIHPEVVAPGQNVRSAWGTDDFNTISGTSMASPHVSGAVLLLKEAFPQLTGSQLLHALYSTAIDLGSTGEDNTYGKGIIDVYAAFQHLSQTYTPVDPQTVKYDLAIMDHSKPQLKDFSCGDSFNLKLLLENRGDSAISNVQADLWLNGSKVNSNLIALNTPGLANKGDTAWVSVMNALNIASGGENVIRVELKTGKPDYDPVNNTRYIRFNKRNLIPLPFIDDFSAGLEAANWHVGNDDLATTWDSIAVNDSTDRGVYINYSDYFPRENQKDILVSPLLDLPPSGKITMKFDLAYQEYAPISIFHDSLRVYASTDCGKTRTHLLYEKFGSDLNTVGSTGADFVPATPADWRRDSVDLSFLAGQDVVLIVEGVNRNGNNLYLDNIHVYEGANDPVHLKEFEPDYFKIYPNPVENLLRVESMASTEDGIHFTISNIQGRILKKGVCENEIQLRDIPSGVYILRLKQGDNSQQQKLIRR